MKKQSGTFSISMICPLVFVLMAYFSLTMFRSTEMVSLFSTNGTFRWKLNKAVIHAQFIRWGQNVNLMETNTFFKSQSS